MAGEDGGGEFLCFGADDETVAAVRTEEERVDVVDVDLGLEQEAGDVLQLGFRLELDGDDGDVVMREAVLVEDLLRPLGVVDDDADDGRVGRVDQAQRHDVDVGTGKGFDHFVESSHLVLDEDGELADRSEVRLLGNIGGHRESL